MTDIMNSPDVKQVMKQTGHVSADGAGQEWGEQPVRAAEAQPVAGSGAVRVRSGLLDRLVNHAGEVSITRARIDTDVRLLQSSLNDLTDNLDRLRRQLRAQARSCLHLLEVAT